MAPVWRYLDDVYVGDRAWCEVEPDGTKKPTKRSRIYLPQEPGEDDPDYDYRLNSSVFSDKFAQAIRDYVGLVFNNGIRLVDVPAAITKSWEDLNGMGLSGNRFLAELAKKALRRGHNFTLVDYPGADPTIRSLLDQQRSKRHPFWVDISPLQVLNWRWVKVGNRQQLSQVTIALTKEISVGRYGEKTETQYLELLPGRWRLLVIEEDRNGRQFARLIDEGSMGLRRRGRIVPFDFIPLSCIYGGDRVGFFESNPTMLTLAQLNVAHYQTKSDHRQKMHRCCFPQAVRVGGQGEDLILGPKVIVDVPIGGSFGWAEPRADSLDRSRQELIDYETEMDFLGADYLIKPGDRQAAATTEVQATKVESELYLFASDFAQGITECLGFHAAYLGLDESGHVELNTKFFERTAHDPQLLMAYLQMKEMQALSTDELRRLARDRNFLPQNFDIGVHDDELIETS